MENHHFAPPESNHRTKTMSLDSFKTCTGKLGREFDDRKLRLRATKLSDQPCPHCKLTRLEVHGPPTVIQRSAHRHPRYILAKKHVH